MKKLLSIMLTALLILTILSFGAVTAFADESHLRQTLQDPSGGDETLTENIKLSLSINLSGNHTLDLAGKTLSIGDAATETDAKMPAIVINSGSLTIVDSVGGGSVSVYGNQTPCIQVVGGRLTLRSGSINAVGRDAPLGVLISGNGSFLMNGGKVSVVGALTIGVTVSGEADFTMNGGTILASGSVSSIGLFVDKAVLADRVSLVGGYISGSTYSISIADANPNLANVGALFSKSTAIAMDGTTYGRDSFTAKAYSSDMSIGGAAAPQSAASSASSSSATESSAAETSGDPESNPETGARIRAALLWLIPVVIVAVCAYLAISAYRQKKKALPKADPDDSATDDKDKE